MAWRSVADPSLGPENYTWFFGNSAALSSLTRTLGVAAICTVVCLLVGYPYAYLMTLVGGKWRLVLTVVVLVPFWTSLMVRTFAWRIILQDTGVLNDVLGMLGLGPFQFIRTTLGVVIGMAQVLAPFMVLPLFAVMSGIDRRLLVAAQGMGARPSVAFLKVFVPLSLPGVVAGSITVFISALGFYVTPALLGSPDNALISQQVFTQVNGLLEWGRGGAMGMILLVTTLALVALVALTGRAARSRTE
jgi:putative spermidine/putrescine transport system permease protein